MSRLRELAQRVLSVQPEAPALAAPSTSNSSNVKLLAKRFTVSPLSTETVKHPETPSIFLHRKAARDIGRREPGVSPETLVHPKVKHPETVKHLFHDTDGGTWPDEISRDDYEERAAIMQFDGGLSRDEAGFQAWKATMEARGIALHPSSREWFK